MLALPSSQTVASGHAPDMQTLKMLQYADVLLRPATMLK